MNERYTQISVDKTRIYIPDSPVVIEAHALLKDNATNEVMAQLKFQSITHKAIKALAVGLECFDVMGNELQGVDSFQYLDLDIQRDARFGQGTPIPLPDKSTRSYIVASISIVYQDGGIWTSKEDAAWVKLPAKRRLGTGLGDDLLGQQYKRDITDKAVYYPQESEGLWLCACGYENHNSELTCHVCCTPKAKIFDGLDADVLREHLKEHEKELGEKKAAEEKARLAKRYRRKAWLKKNKMPCIVGGAVAILLLMVIFSTVSCGNAASDASDSGSLVVSALSRSRATYL